MKLQRPHGHAVLPIPFEAVYEEHYSKVYNYVYRILLHRQNTEDVVSETFLRALRSYSSYNSEKGSLSTWLCTIAHHCCMNLVQSGAYRTGVSLEAMREAGAAPEAVENEDTAEGLLWDILEKLTPEERAFLNLRYGMELTNQEKTVYRKVEVSTTASDVWEYRPDGTRLTVHDADETGYGSELILEGPGKFKGKCRLNQYGDDVIHAGSWTGSILFTVTCTPDPQMNEASTDVEAPTDSAEEAPAEAELSGTAQDAGLPEDVAEPMQDGQPDEAAEPAQPEAAEQADEAVPQEEGTPELVDLPADTEGTQEPELADDVAEPVDAAI